MADIDRKTIAALVRGEERAYATVVDTLYKPVYRFALRLCGDVSMAEDVTQETFLAVWQGIGSFAGKSRFSTWVFGIAYRQFLRVRDKRRVDTVSLDQEQAEKCVSDACSLAESVSASMQVHSALSCLSDVYREAVLLVHIQGLTYREASEVLGVPIGTVKSRLNAAFEALRDLLRESEVSGDEMREPESLSR